MIQLEISIFLCLITTSMATVKLCSGRYEEFREGSVCQADCSSLYSDMMCISKLVQECYCKMGYVRNYKWKCIKVEDCYKDRCGMNEFRACGSACDTTCATLGKPCPIMNAQCVDMCYCAEGFARDDCGKCIRQADCPAYNCTGPNEEYSRNTDCTCDDLDQDACTMPPSKNAGCRCVDGYVRDKNGLCIQAGLCPRCGSFEYFTKSACPKTCENMNFEKRCKDRPKYGCFCKEGYVRAQNSMCMLPEYCSPMLDESMM